MIGAGSGAIRITADIFSTWRAAGITCEHELFVTSATCLNDVDAILNHHLAAVIGLGSLAWAGHLVHVSLPVDVLLRLGCDPLSLPESGKTLDPALSGLLLSGGTLADVFTLNWPRLTGLLTLFGGLNPATGSLWLSDIAHHHLAVAVVFLVAGHLDCLASGPQVESNCRQRSFPVLLAGCSLERRSLLGTCLQHSLLTPT